MIIKPTSEVISSKGQWKRCGVLIVLNHTSVVTMVDRKFGQLTDPGGARRHYEDPLRAALRECAEETRGIFDFRDKYHDLKNKTFSIVTDDGQFHVIVTMDISGKDHIINLSRKYSLSFARGRRLMKNGISVRGLSGTGKETLENSFMLPVKLDILQEIIQKGVPLENLRTSWDPSPVELNCDLMKVLGKGKTHYPCVYSRVSRTFTILAQLFDGHSILRNRSHHCDSCINDPMDCRESKYQDENSLYFSSMSSVD